MADRINEGYTITDSIQVGETEFVFGKRDGKIPMYVTWACKGGDNYYWGHYFSDLLEAKKDLPEVLITIPAGQEEQSCIE